jgi:murein DD-endopeptidase MepM/ murein hydrolase activator NlpD
MERPAAQEVLQMSSNQHPSQPAPRFLTIGRLLAAAVLYLLLAVVPPSPLERPLFVARLLTAGAPAHVAVPVDRVEARNLRDSWGNPRSGGRHHEGIDIFAPRGTRVLSSTEGLVSRIGTDPLGGRVVWVLGPGGQMHYYAHLDATSGIRVGDRVAVGDVLGAVGTSGNARGGPPHLHYGIYAGGGAINPYPLLAPEPPVLRSPRSPRTRTHARAPQAESTRARHG